MRLDAKMSFICMRMKNDFHIKRWAATVVLKRRPGGTRKWPIVQGNPSRDPSYPKRADFSYISWWNMVDHIHEEQKVGTARKVTPLAGSPFCDGWVTLIWFAHPGQLGQGETSRACASAVARATDFQWHSRAHGYFSSLTYKSTVSDLTNQIMIPESGYWMSGNKTKSTGSAAFFSLPGHARLFSFSTRSTEKPVRRLLNSEIFSRSVLFT